MSILKEICTRKHAHIKERKSVLPLDEVQKRVNAAPSSRGFLNALNVSKPNAVIAEIKKASPSKGVIRHDFDPRDIAVQYKQYGASCISVLTDTPYFQGRDEDLINVLSNVDIPVLRKDFMLDEYQIYESRMLGADCILLIMAALTDDEAASLYGCAESLGMDVLVEVHDEIELNRALRLKPQLIGVNNRNLKTMDVTLDTSLSLAEKMPETCFKISESGIKNRDDIIRLQKAGYQGFLIGETLMSSRHNGLSLKKLLDTNQELM